MTEHSTRKRRRTWPLTLVMLVSGVWTLGIVGLYGLGHFYQVNWFQERPLSTTVAGMSEGHVLVYTFSHPEIAGAAGGARREMVSRAATPSAFTGYRWWFASKQMPLGMAYVIPLWAIGLPAAAAAGLAWRRRTVVRRGLCPKCGYDVRGLTHAACPKCGRTLGI